MADISPSPFFLIFSAHLPSAHYLRAGDMIRVTCPSDKTVAEVRLCLARGSLAPHNCSHLAHGCHASEAFMAPVLRLNKPHDLGRITAVAASLLVGISGFGRIIWQRLGHPYLQREVAPLLER